LRLNAGERYQPLAPKNVGFSATIAKPLDAWHKVQPYFFNQRMGPIMSDEDLETNSMSSSMTERRIRKQVRRMAEFYRHAFIYVVIISLIWVFNFMTTKSDRPLWAYWAIWPTIGWGIGLFFHGLSAFPNSLFLGSGWEERKVQELMKKMERK
jgi:hypothetical protein